MINLKPITLALGLLLTNLSFAQPVFNTFESSRIINHHSNETIKAHLLEYRISHRFGDLLGAAGGWETFYGIEVAQDIDFAFDYGISNRWNIGIGRMKGAYEARALLHGFTKYQLVQQHTAKSPIGITLLGTTNFSTMSASAESTAIAAFPKTVHRFSYLGQIIFSKKFGDNLGLNLSPTYSHRNYVDQTASNGLFSIAGGVRLALTKQVSIIGESQLPISETHENFTIPWGIGATMNTGGHHFSINFTNARGISPIENLPNNTSIASDGQFRFGFTIARKFKT